MKRISMLMCLTGMFTYLSGQGNFTAKNLIDPYVISVQGVITDSLGVPKPDGDYLMTFTLYDQDQGGAAIWQKTEYVSTERGLFHTYLGDIVPLDMEIPFDRQYWVGVQVGDELELNPRIRLTSVPYAIHAREADYADTARHHLGNLDVFATVNHDDKQIEVQGNLEVDKGNIMARQSILLGASGMFFFKLDNQNTLRIGPNNNHKNKGLSINQQGNVIIGGTNPISNDALLNILGKMYGEQIVATEAFQLGKQNSFQFHLKNGGELQIAPTSSNGGAGIRITRDGKVSTDYFKAKEIHGEEIHADKRLIIHGGQDIAEKFNHVYNMDEVEDHLSPGTVVVAARKTDGKIKRSEKAYSSRVVGIFAGANGIHPAIVLNQDNINQGDITVSLVGRVFVKASAENGAIRPGDHLVTAKTPGHVMRVKPNKARYDQVVGKALGTLRKGNGFIETLIK